jgi:UDP-GlcNAc:undecaprenyl-phosphate GlcNAc-1-phosphate transferase
MNVVGMKILFSFVLSLLVTLYLVPICSILAHRFKFLDIPDGSLKRHKEPTPYLGGVAVYCGFLMGVSLTASFENNLSLFLIGVTLLLFLGLIDDLIALSSYQKFIGQCIIALCFLKVDLLLKESFFVNLWLVPLLIFWIASVTNAFNLIDIMDGLATTAALTSSLVFLVIALIGHSYTVTILLAAFIGALGGFLWYNRPPARIYLGDAGSLFIGGFLATIPFLLSWGVYNPMGYLAPIGILGIPLLEVTSLVIIRTYKGIPFFNGSPDHFACYLMAQGWKKPIILWYVAILNVIAGIIATLFYFNLISFATTLGLGVLFLGFWIYILVPKEVFWGHRSF